MKWGKDILVSRHLIIARSVLIILMLLAFIFGNKWLLFTSLVGTIILLFHHLYFLKLGEKLIFDNKKEISRLNIDDDGNWKLTFINKGVPIIKGNLLITFDDCIEPTNLPFHKKRSFIEVNIPFKAWTNEKIEVQIPFIAVKRGVSHIYKLEVKIQHLFGSGIVILNCNEIVKMKKLVYPQRKALNILKEQPVLLHGIQDARTSLYYDPLQPIGTREYTNGDSFQHIHWKASAKLQQLQTKIFPNMGARTWLFVLNISERHSINRELEEIISYTAFLIEKAVKENIPFALAINVRTHGDIPYFYLSEGEGRVQRQKALEMLSMLSVHSFPISYPFMLKDIKKRGTSFPIVIHLGENKRETNQVLLSYRLGRSAVFEVKTVNGQGAMNEWIQYRKVNF